jgi:hypothetical protein
MWRCTPVIPTTREALIGGSGKKNLKKTRDQVWKKTKAKKG